jgi:hypothetical protein
MPSLFGGGGGQTKEEKALEQAETQAIQLGLSEAKGTIPQATAALQDPLKFFQALLTGDRATLMSVLGPEITSLTSQYDTASRAASEFAPRGGGRTAALQTTPYKEAADISGLIGQARQTGAAGVESVAGMLSQLGLGELGVATSTAAAARGAAETEQQTKIAAQQQAGQGVGELLALLLLGV